MKNNNKFKYVIMIAVLIIPFMYSFFYLKAYWNPYGEGNIDNLPVAIVNEDIGDKGNNIIKNIKDSKKLKITVLDSIEAENGLNNGDYYAIINIPKDFTSNLESAKEEEKIHPTITYSPNQKSNYLASQIINNVVNVVEKNLDNEVNKEIIKSLEDNVTSVPDKLSTISDGFTKLNNGTKKLENGTSSLKNGAKSLNNGAKTLFDGSNTLNTNYNTFNDGIKSLKDGANKLNTEVKKLDSISSSVDTLKNGVSTLKSGSNVYAKGLNSYVTGVNKSLELTESLVNFDKSICPMLLNLDATKNNPEIIKVCTMLSSMDTSSISTLKTSGKTLTSKYSEINNGISTLNSSLGKLDVVNDKLASLQKGVNSLSDGADNLYSNSLKINNGINSLNNGIFTLYKGTNDLNSGISTLYNGASTLNSSVVKAKKDLDNNINNTKKEVKKAEGLSNYSKEPVNIDTNPVNEVLSYGTAFSPMFISIALWVGSLMAYMVLYYDKEEKFKIFGINNKNHLQRSIAYHAFISISAIILGVLLQLFLDFNITNTLLYYIVLILVANTFMAIMNFLITKFGDVGKFIGLIILVLQLAAAGGTFPIETVTKGFRWLNPVLPMTYTNKLLKEVLITFEKNLFTKYLLITLGILIAFALINLVLDLIDKKKIKNDK